MTPCETNVAYFPFDVTQCSIVIASYGFTESSIAYYWDEKGVILNSDNLDDNGFIYLYAHLGSRVSFYSQNFIKISLSDEKWIDKAF